MKINICHLYPNLLNLYGDKGNVETLYHRIKNRGIDAFVTEVNENDKIDFDNIDILYIGAGSEKEQRLVLDMLNPYREELLNYIESSKVLLGVSSGYEILGKYYKTKSDSIKALEILDFSMDYQEKRKTDNVILNSGIINSTIVGFENHNTYLINSAYKPLGEYLYPNKTDEKAYEGIVYKNTILTHLLGPVLPKNPILCDFIIQKAIDLKDETYKLTPLDDSLETLAHNYIVNRFSE